MGQQEKLVMNELHTPKTSREIAHITGLERSSVCGRVNGLISKRMVVEHDIVTCSTTGKRVHRYIKVTEC